jgi:hypothetical protein
MHLIGHAEIAAWIKALFFQEEAIGAVQVAGRARRLGHDVKGPGRLIQCHLSNIECTMPLIIILPISIASKNPEMMSSSNRLFLWPRSARDKNHNHKLHPLPVQRKYGIREEVGSVKIRTVKNTGLFHAQSLIRAGINTSLASCALFFVHHCYPLVVQGNSFDRAFLDASFTAYAFLLVNDCRHQFG